MNARVANFGLPMFGTVTLLVLWQGITVLSDIPEVVLPSPLVIFQTFVDTRELILRNLWSTLEAAAVGFVGAVLLAIAIAVVLTASARIREALMPFVIAMNTVPRVTLAPLFIFYIGEFQVRHLIALWVAFFPILVNALEGLGNLDGDLEMLLESFDATLWQEFKIVRIQNALPFIFDGMKLGVSLAIVGAVVGEYILARDGIGALALTGIRQHATDLVMAAVGVTGLVSVTVFFTLFVLQERVIYWKETDLFPE